MIYLGFLLILVRCIVFLFVCMVLFNIYILDVVGPLDLNDEGFDIFSAFFLVWRGWVNTYMRYRYRIYVRVTASHPGYPGFEIF